MAAATFTNRMTHSLKELAKCPPNTFTVAHKQSHHRFKGARATTRKSSSVVLKRKESSKLQCDKSSDSKDLNPIFYFFHNS